MLTESDNALSLDHLDTRTLVGLMNEQDQSVPKAVAEATDQITALAEVFAETLISGHRVFYIGAGTSGRLGVVDASELPPTFGVEFELVVGIIAGGDSAIRKAVEFAEDDTQQAWQDLQAHGANADDLVIGIAASGSTPYVVGGLKAANLNGLNTGCIVCNQGSAVAAQAKYPVEVLVGPEFVMGSTRLKAGTAQKLVLNMLSTIAMVRWGRVKGNKMVYMQLTNHKLIERGTRLVMQETNLGHDEAKSLLLKQGSVAKALFQHKADSE